MCQNVSVCVGAYLASLNNKSSVLPAPAKKSVLSAVMTRLYLRPQQLYHLATAILI